MTLLRGTDLPLAKTPFLVVGLLVAFAVDVVEHAPEAVEPDDRGDYLQNLPPGSDDHSVGEDLESQK
jgi:hypothetical protein